MAARITPDTVVAGVDPFDISEERFTAIQHAAGSPAAPHSHAGYMLLGTLPVSIAFLLAVFKHESTLATNPDAIVIKYGMRNPGNCRSTRTGVGVVINTSTTPYAYRLRDGTIVPPTGALPAGATALFGGKGPFVRYPSWEEGWRDLAWRLIDPTYVYAREGRVTIRQIITRFAPKSDGNDPEGYIAAVVADMNDWKEEPMAGDIPGVAFIAADSRHHTKGRIVAWADLWIFHHTNGWDSLDWLTVNRNSNVSSTVLLWPDGTIRAQLVRLGDTPHTTGVYNPRSMSSEWERKWPEQRDISDTQYANIADSVTRVLLAERARGNPYWQGIPPRSQFGDHNDYYDTACPANLSVDRLYELIVVRLADTLPTEPDDGNPWFLHLGDGVLAQYAYRRGFRGVVEGLAISRYAADPNSAALALFGPPEEEEWPGDDGRTYQRARKGTLVYTRGLAVPWDVALLDRDAALPKRAAKAKGKRA